MLLAVANQLISRTMSERRERRKQLDGLDEDTGQDRERRSSGNPFEDNGQGVGKLGAIDTEFQGMPLFVMA